MPTPSRVRADRCPGALRPWPADDGMLVRLRLIGGRVTSSELRAVAEVAETYGDGHVHLTSRANLQVRGLPGRDGALAPEVLTALADTGLIPAPSHELVRNVLVSPQSGLDGASGGGRADLRPIAAELDRLLCAEPVLAALPGRFLFVLDDGRGDLVARPCDLGLAVLDAETAQLRIGDGWGPLTPLDTAADTIVALAIMFGWRRGEGPEAPRHVGELSEPLLPPTPPDPRLPTERDPLPYGDVPGGRHVEIPGGLLDRSLVDELTAAAPTLIVTPWRGVLIPQENR
ncbi:MAG: nitrite reductase [Kineosporiaceae bacterium]